MTSSDSAFPYFFLSFGSLGLALRILYRGWGDRLTLDVGAKAARRRVQEVYLRTFEFEEILSSGTLPSEEMWQALSRLPSPWGALISESLLQLRTRGAALLPTLKRLRTLAMEQSKTLADAQARSSQALAQALGGVLIVILMGGTLYALLPGVSDNTWAWGMLCSGSAALAVIGAFWIISMAEYACWAGLPKDSKNWILAAQCAGERFLAIVRAGSPADLAWSNACELLFLEAPGLAAAWGHSIWKASPQKGFANRGAAQGGAAKDILIEAGDSIRRAVQVSLMEGRPCTERVESVLASLHHDIRAQIDTELSLLPTRALKPLFIFVAPSVFLLLAAGFFFSFDTVLKG